MNNTTTATHMQCTDPVLTEVWRIQEEIAAEHNYDVRKIATAAIESQKKYSDRIVDLSKNIVQSLADNLDDVSGILKASLLYNVPILKFRNEDRKI